MNDRQLRYVTDGLGGKVNGTPREDGFDITVASEVMAIFCLATDLADLKARLGRIVVGYNLRGRTGNRRPDRRGGRHGRPAERRHRSEPGADAGEQPGHHPRRALCQHRPRLQQRDGHPAEPGAGGLRVTEAGFGADLGAEKFLDIKCRKAGLNPSAVVLVATVRALKHHGGCPKDQLGVPSVDYLAAGVPNLLRHLDNMKNQFGLPVCVAINASPPTAPRSTSTCARSVPNRACPAR